MGIMITNNGIKSSRQCLHVYNKAIRILGMINRSIMYKEKEILVNLYKTLVRPHLEYCMNVWSSHYAKDKELLEKIQRRFMRMFKELRGKDYHERLRYLNLWTLEESRNRQDLIEVFKMYKRFTKLDISELFTKELKVKCTKGHSLKLEKLGCVRDSRMQAYFFSHRVVGRWNALDQHTVDATSISAFKGSE